MDNETQILPMLGEGAVSQGERRGSEQLQINGQLPPSEERFRDLFDEAPIAYVIGGLDWRIIQANRTAINILGVKPEDKQDSKRRTSLSG